MLVHTNCFIMLDALAAPNTFENFRLLVLAIRWNQDGHWPADDLFGRIPKEPLCSPVPSADDAVEVLADDGIIGGFDNGGNSLCCVQEQQRLISCRREGAQAGHHAQVFRVEA